MPAAEQFEDKLILQANAHKPAFLTYAARKFEFVINLQTARTIGLEIPPTLLRRAEHLSNALNFRPYASKTAFRATHQPKAGRQGNHYPETVGEMRRTPRGGQWYAKPVSNLLARA